MMPLEPVTPAKDEFSRLSTDRELLVRIDERTQSFAREFAEFRTQVVYRTEFEPVKKIVYGLVGLILATVVLALVGMVVVGSAGR